MRRRWLLLGCWVPLGCTVPNPLLDDTDGDASTGSDASTHSGDSTGPDPAGSTTAEPGTDSSTSTTDPSTTAADESSTGTPTCDADALCIAPAPEGWNGPVAVVDTPAAEDPPGCGGAYPTPSIELGYDKVDGDDTCDCACGSPNGSVCTGPTLFNYNNATCSGNPSQTFTVNQACQDIVDQDPDDSWEAVSVISGGSCPVLATGSVAATTFGHNVTLCAGAGPAGVCEGGTCLPIPEAPFSNQLCIWQQGEVECPDGAFTDRTVRYGAIDQGRSCATCTCGSPEGTCSGTMTLRTGSDCGGVGAGTVQFNGPCVEGVGVNLIVRVGLSIGGRTESCDPSTPGVTGESTVSDPVTICCTPP